MIKIRKLMTISIFSIVLTTAGFFSGKAIAADRISKGVPLIKTATGATEIITFKCPPGTVASPNGPLDCIDKEDAPKQ